MSRYNCSLFEESLPGARQKLISSFSEKKMQLPQNKAEIRLHEIG